MKNWFATANFMYRQVFVNSFASSASLDVVRIVFVASCPNSSVARSRRDVVVRADDLRQRVELLERVALGDPLRAERHVDPRAALGEMLRDVLGRARVDGAAQDDEGAVAEVRRDLVDGLLEDRHRRAEELVDRRADDDDELLGPFDHRAVRAEAEPAGREDLAQQLVGAVLHERHLAGGDPVEGRLVRVVDADAQAGLGEGEAQGQADVAAAAEDDDVEVGGFRSVGHVPGAYRHRPPMVPTPVGTEQRHRRSDGDDPSSSHRPIASRRPRAGRRTPRPSRRHDDETPQASSWASQPSPPSTTAS